MIFKGYISSRPLNNNSVIDQSVQNLVIRNSCEKRGFLFYLSATEYGMDNCFLVLNQIINDLNKNKYKGIAFYSLAQLPLEANERKKIYKATVMRGKQILFSLENFTNCFNKGVTHYNNFFLKYSTVSLSNTS